MAGSWHWQVLEHDGELYFECNPEKFSVLFQLSKAERGSESAAGSSWRRT
jgi:hypothetical protein